MKRILILVGLILFMAGTAYGAPIKTLPELMIFNIGQESTGNTTANQHAGVSVFNYGYTASGTGLSELNRTWERPGIFAIQVYPSGTSTSQAALPKGGTSSGVTFTLLAFPSNRYGSPATNDAATGITIFANQAYNTATWIRYFRIPPAESLEFGLSTGVTPFDQFTFKLISGIDGARFDVRSDADTDYFSGTSAWPSQ